MLDQSPESVFVKGLDGTYTLVNTIGAKRLGKGVEEIIGKRINNTRAEQVIESGATMVASSCPFCATMLHDGIMETDKQIPIKDIAEILDEATD